MDEQQTLIAEFRQQLMRAAWRMQYHNRFRMNRELPIAAAEGSGAGEADEQTLSVLYVQEVLLGIPSDSGRSVMRKLIVEGKSEKEVSRELGISQQAVSKWKRKSVETLRRQMERFAN